MWRALGLRWRTGPMCHVSDVFLPTASCSPKAGLAVTSVSGGWWGGAGILTFSCSCTHIWTGCYATRLVYACVQTRSGWGDGVGVFPLPFRSLPHTPAAMLHRPLARLHIYLMLRQTPPLHVCWHFIIISCYARIHWKVGTGRWQRLWGKCERKLWRHYLYVL